MRQGKIREPHLRVSLLGGGNPFLGLYRARLGLKKHSLLRWRENILAFM